MPWAQFKDNVWAFIIQLSVYVALCLDILVKIKLDQKCQCKTVKVSDNRDNRSPNILGLKLI